MINNYNKKDITNIALREDGELYIGDIVQIKKDGWLNVKNCLLCGYNYRTQKWIVKYFNTKSGIIYEEIDEKIIVKIKETTIKINTSNNIHPYNLEILNYKNNK